MREYRSDELAKMQLEMERAMKNAAQDFDATDVSDGDGNDHSPSGPGPGPVPLSAGATTEVAALVKRAKRATGCGQVSTTTKMCPSDLLVALVLVVALLFG